VVALTSTFVTRRVYGIPRILRSAHMSIASMREFCGGGPCLAPIQQDRDYVSLVEAHFGIQPDASLPDSFFQQVHAGSSYANPTQDLTSAVTRGVDHATQVDKGIDHFNMTIFHLDC